MRPKRRRPATESIQDLKEWFDRLQKGADYAGMELVDKGTGYWTFYRKDTGAVIMLYNPREKKWMAGEIWGTCYNHYQAVLKARERLDRDVPFIPSGGKSGSSQP
jgi:hypothetical protein